jgi:hypothetical protein
MAEEEAAAPPAWLLWARLAIGLAQGALLYALIDAAAASWWVSDMPAARVAGQFAALYAPVLIIGALGVLRPVTLAVWALTATGFAAAIGWYAFARWNGADATFAPFGGYNGAYLIVPIVLFVAHHLVAAGDETRKLIAPYDRYFDLGWRHSAQLALATLFVGAFWAVLLLGASLFRLIGIYAPGEIIAKQWFLWPATCTMLAAAIHLTDLRAGLVRGTRALGLLLLSWLLPAMTVLAGAFLVALAFSGLAPLWATRAATPLLLGAAGALVVLINAAYQDGHPETRAAFVLRWSARAAGVLLTPLAVLAGYALYLRIDQYGLTPDRVFAAGALVVVACYAVFYLVGAFWPRWMKPLEIGNLASAVLITAVSGALFSPLADPARLSVDDQMARLAARRTPPEKFDVRALRWEGARYGEAALKRLQTRRDALGQRAASALAATSLYEEQTAPAAQVPTMADLDLQTLPPGPLLPATFLRARLIPACSEPCTAQMIDLNGDEALEVLVVNGGDLLIFAQNELGAWRQIGANKLGALGKSAVQAPMTLAPPEVSDLMIAGQRLRVDLFAAPFPKLSAQTVRELKRAAAKEAAVEAGKRAGAAVLQAPEPASGPVEE